MKSYLVHIRVSNLRVQLLVLEMRRMVKDMIEELDIVEEKSSSVSEELYGKLELKVKKKFNEEVERLEKSFRRIIE